MQVSIQRLFSHIHAIDAILLEYLLTDLFTTTEESRKAVQQLEIGFASLSHGFDPSRPTNGMGLKSIQERAKLLDGELEFSSAKGEGTRIRLVIPESEVEN